MPFGFRNLIEKGLKVLNIIAQAATNNKCNIMFKETVTRQCKATFAFSHFKSNLNCNKFETQPQAQTHTTQVNVCISKQPE